MKGIKLMAIGVVLGMAAMSGLFNEAGDAQAASRGWCVGVCQQR